MARRRVPTKVKIGPITYKIKVNKKFECGKAADMWGEMVIDKQNTIRLHPDMNDEKAKAILLHEILHAALDQSNLQLNDTQEEKLVRSLDHILTATFQQNPKVRDYIFGDK